MISLTELEINIFIHNKTKFLDMSFLLEQQDKVKWVCTGNRSMPLSLLITTPQTRDTNVMKMYRLIEALTSSQGLIRGADTEKTENN